MNERLPKFNGTKLLAEIEKSAAGLTYISETDSPIEPYSGGKAETVEVSRLTADQRWEKTSSRSFFARLTAEEEWYDAAQKENAHRFAELEKLLDENLRDVNVFKVGRVQLDIYVVGLDADNNLIGIKTKAVET